MKLLMKYPTGNSCFSEDTMGEVHGNETNFYIEESNEGRYFRIYGEAAIEFLERKEVHTSKDKEIVDDAISLLKSKLNGIN